MSEYSNHDLDTAGVRSRVGGDNHAGYERASETTPAISPSDSHSLMREAGIGASNNSPVRAATLQTMQQTHGNRAVQRFMQANPTSSNTGRVSVQRMGISQIIPSVMDQARKAAAAAAATKPKGGPLEGWFEGAGGPGSPTAEGSLGGMMENGIWDSIRQGGSAAWDLMQNQIQPDPNQLPAEPGVWAPPLVPVGPVVEPDNLPVPGMWPESDSWV